MVYWIFITAGLFLASVFDVATREVPDILSYCFVILGLANGAFHSITAFAYEPFLFSLLGFLSMLALSMLLFYSGQWGGGDAKLLMALGAWLGLGWGKSQSIPLLVTFLVNLILVGGVYGLSWTLYLLVRHYNKFRKEYTKQLKRFKRVRLMGALIAIGVAGIAFSFIKEPFTRIVFSLFPLLLFLFVYLWIAVKAIEKACLYKWVEPEILSEGDWVVKPVNIGRRTLVKPADFGVTKEQIELLVRLHRTGKLKRVLIKEGLPFVPSLFLAAIVSWIFASWFLLVL